MLVWQQQSNLASFQSIWWGLMGPADIPTEVLETINRAVNASVVEPPFKARLTALGAQVLPLTSQQFATRFVAEKDQWEQIVLQAKIQPQPEYTTRREQTTICLIFKCCNAIA